MSGLGALQTKTAKLVRFALRCYSIIVTSVTLIFVFINVRNESVLMAFSLRLHFPILELIWSNRAIAMIKTKDGATVPCKIKPILREFFVTPYGWFRMKPEYSTNMFKQKFYDFVSWNQNPIDYRAVKELELFLIKTDRVALEKWIFEEDAKLLKQVEEETGMNLSYETDEKGDLKKDANGNPIPIEQKKMNRILRALREPVSPKVETWLMNFERVEPAGTLTGLEKVIMGKKLLHLMSNPVTAKYPIILMVVLAFVVIAAITQGGNILDSLFAGIKSIQSGGRP